MSTWWLIRDDDVKKIVDGLVIAPGRDWWGPNGQQEKQAFFDDLEHTLHSGLHETDAVPDDFQTVVTIHADPLMSPETASALGEMSRLAVEMVTSKPSSAARIAKLRQALIDIRSNTPTIYALARSNEALIEDDEPAAARDGGDRGQG